jgi:cardiolipin synthase
LSIAADRCTAKALADDHWATVGSSNLDPLSLSLNLEANLIIHDRQFNQTLRDNLNGLIAEDCKQVDKSMLPKRSWWNVVPACWPSTFCATSRRG